MPFPPSNKKAVKTETAKYFSPPPLLLFKNLKLLVESLNTACEGIGRFLVEEFPLALFFSSFVYMTKWNLRLNCCFQRRRRRDQQRRWLSEPNRRMIPHNLHTRKHKNKNKSIGASGKNENGNSNLFDYVESRTRVAFNKSILWKKWEEEEEKRLLRGPPLATTYGTQWRKSQAPPTTTYAAEVEDSTIVGSVSFLTWKYMYCILSMYVMLNLCFAICWIVDLRPNWRFFALLSSQFPLLRVPWAFQREKKPGGGEKVFFSARNYLWSKHTQQWL